MYEARGTAHDLLHMHTAQLIQDSDSIYQHTNTRQQKHGTLFTTAHTELRFHRMYVCLDTRQQIDTSMLTYEARVYKARHNMSYCTNSSYSAYTSLRLHRIPTERSIQQRQQYVVDVSHLSGCANAPSTAFPTCPACCTPAQEDCLR